MPKGPPPISEGYKHNFEQLCKACDNDELALVSVIRKADQQPQVLVCAVCQGDDGQYSITPFATMIDGNPYDIYEPPASDEERQS